MNTQGEDGFPLLSIRYEGGDAESHVIDLNQLGESIQGFARIFAVTANLLKTGKLSRQITTLDVRVVAVPVAGHNCFEVWAVIQDVASTKELWSGAAGAVLAVVVAYVLSKRDKEEMKYLSEALKQSLSNNQGNIDKLLAIIEKMSDSLRPAAKKALTPIDRSCSNIDLYADKQKFHGMDKDSKEFFANADTIISEHTEIYTGTISEFDMNTGGCRVTLEGEDSRIAAQVTDPVYSKPNNYYVESMSSARPLKFIAKSELDEEGRIIKLFISDTVDPES